MPLRKGLLFFPRSVLHGNPVSDRKGIFELLFLLFKFLYEFFDFFFSFFWWE